VSNRVELSGWLVDAPTMRHSPAGIPITRALLEHESRQVEAGRERWIRFRVGLRATGSPIAELLADIQPSTQLNISGVLLRSRQRNADADPIIISVSRIEPLTHIE